MVSRIVKKVFLLLLVFVILSIIYLLIKLDDKIKIDYFQEPEEKKYLDENLDEASIDEASIDDNTNNLEEVVSEDLRAIASQEAQARPMPFPGLEGMGLEFMDEEEKKEFRIPSKREAQILTRDFEGNISSYKVIKQPENIVYPK